MRVLLIEDDEATAASIELMLKSEAMSVVVTDEAEDGLDLAKLYDYDIILLDDTLPDADSYNILKSIRREVKSPIIVLTTIQRAMVGHRDLLVKAFSLGADDFIAKPFHKDELVARIHAIVRRAKGHAQSIISAANLTINLNTKTVMVNNTEVKLTGKEYQMIELLALRQNTTLTKEMFLNHIYGGRDEPEAKIIDVFICKLRRKLGALDHGTNYIETVWGRGYVLRSKPTLVPLSASPMTYVAAAAHVTT